jgi:hypothetical protein
MQSVDSFSKIVIFPLLPWKLCFFVARTVRFDQIKNCLLVAHLMKYEVTSESLGFVTIFLFEILLPQIPPDDVFVFRYHGN